MEDTELQEAEAPSFISAFESVDYKGRPLNAAKTGRWNATSFLLVAEVLERFTYYGISANLVTYLTSVLHQGTVTSTTNVFNWDGTTWVTPLFGAFVADAFLGRFRTLLCFDVPYLLGLICLTISVSLPQLHPPHCAPSVSTCTVKPSRSELAFFWFSLYLIAFALAGVKPCLVTFAADQFDEGDPVERRLKQSFFNWFYYAIEIGAFSAQTVMVYIQENVGWGVGYGILTGSFCLSFIVTLVGTPFYRHQKLPHYSPLTCIVQVFVAAFRKWRVPVPSDKSELYEECTTGLGFDQRRKQVQHTPGFLFLDKAAVVTSSSNPSKVGSSEFSGEEKLQNPWRVVTVTQVEEVKQLLRMMPIWFSNTIFSITYPALVQTYFTKQGRTMNRHMGPYFQVPPASLQCFITLFILILIPVYDKAFVPVARRITGNERGITILKRMGIGVFFSIFACIAAALVERKRLHVVREYGYLNSPKEELPITIFWLLPQYLMIGLSEVFFTIATFDFFYTESSPRLRTLCHAMRLSAVGVGLYWGTALTKAVVKITSRNGRQGWIVNNINRCRLDKLYWLCAVIMAVNFCYCLVVSRWYRYRVDDLIESSQHVQPVQNADYISEDKDRSKIETCAVHK